MKHALTFRGESNAIPAGYGLCTACGALLQIEAWLEQDCPGRIPQPKEVAHED